MASRSATDEVRRRQDIIAEEVVEGLEQSLLAVYSRRRVRSMALAVAAMHNREQTKNAVSLEYITNSYFEFIERNLGFFVKAAKDAGADAHEFGNRISSHPLNVDEYSPQITAHLHDFIDAYNYGRRLKTLKGLTPYEYICKIWATEPERFKLNPLHQMPGLNT